MTSKILPQTVSFNNQTIPVFFQDGKPYVAMKPICENIGLNWDGQRQRIQRNHILSKGTVMITAPSKSGKQEYSCLPIGYLNGWLFGVDVNKVKSEIKDTLIKYQLECFDVLYKHFMPKVAEAYPNTITPEQQQQIKEAVLQRVQREGKSYQAVYNEFYREFNIPRYQELPLDKFDEALNWLNDGFSKKTSNTDVTVSKDYHESVQGLALHMLWTNAWWKSFGEAIRVLNPNIAGSIHDHFVDGAIFAYGFISKENLEDFKQSSDHYSWYLNPSERVMLGHYL